MNYLGHLYFSNNNINLMYANLFGDFTKGSDLSRFSIDIQKGIRLHREIDNYIDHHPAVIDLLHSLYESLPKISGIAVDLYFDHLLAKRWSDFHSSPLPEFIQAFYARNMDRSEFNNEEFWYVMDKMKQYDWLSQYKNPEGLQKACNGLSRRISFENALGKAPEIFILNENRISDVFDIFMTDAISHFDDYYNQNKI